MQGPIYGGKFALQNRLDYLIVGREIKNDALPFLRVLYCPSISCRRFIFGGAIKRRVFCLTNLKGIIHTFIKLCFIWRVTIFYFQISIGFYQVVRPLIAWWISLEKTKRIYNWCFSLWFVYYYNWCGPGVPLTFINDSQRALQCFLLDYMPMVHLK